MFLSPFVDPGGLVLKSINHTLSIMNKFKNQKGFAGIHFVCHDIQVRNVRNTSLFNLQFSASGNNLMGNFTVDLAHVMSLCLL